MGFERISGDRMEILLLNGSPSGVVLMESSLEKISQTLKVGGHSISQVVLRDLKVKHCVGCWNCWVKTPGECVHRDDVESVLRQILKADLLLLASPLIMGYPSAILKQFMDRMIPLVHPYIVLDHGECHHQARYGAYPKMGLLLEKETDTDEEDIEIVRDLFERVARNMKTTLQFTYTTDEDLQEVCDEINRH
jgi:multimeric flavodoxin WrbA